MAKEKKSAAQEVLTKNQSAEATEEVRRQMADPGLMKSKVYLAPKNTVNPGAGDLPPEMGGK